MGEKPLAIGTHWAVKVVNTWYEIPGTGKSNTGERNSIKASKGDKSASGASERKYLGKTEKTDREIAGFNKRYEKDHPEYSVLTDNCQTYAIEFVDFLMEGVPSSERIDLPCKESPFC